MAVLGGAGRKAATAAGKRASRKNLAFGKYFATDTQPYP
jgi:hypothetical protein